MDLPHLISRKSSFPILGVLGGIFFPIFKRTFCKQTVNILIIDQTLHYAVSDLGLHLLPMSHKKEPRLKWIK